MQSTNALPLGSDTEEPCPQTLPSSKVPQAIAAEEVRAEEMPQSAALVFARELYAENQKLREVIRGLQKGCKKLNRKRKANANRAEVKGAREAVALGALAKLHWAFGKLLGSREAFRQEEVRAAFREAGELLSGPTK